jgi:hypothetical protein
MIYEKCRDILLRQYEFLKTASVIQEKVRVAVINKEWTDFEGHISAMNIIENKMIDLENERQQFFSAFEALIRQNYFIDDSDPRGKFYSVISHLPDAQRDELTTIYRNLKYEALKVRLANDSLMTYLITVRSTLKEFFDLAFPERAGGKFYTRDGAQQVNDMRSMVLNQSF